MPSIISNSGVSARDGQGRCHLDAYNLECKHINNLETDHCCDWSKWSDEMKWVWCWRGVSCSGIRRPGKALWQWGQGHWDAIDEKKPGGRSWVRDTESERGEGCSKNAMETKRVRTAWGRKSEKETREQVGIMSYRAIVTMVESSDFTSSATKSNQSILSCDIFMSLLLVKKRSL